MLISCHSQTDNLFNFNCLISGKRFNGYKRADGRVGTATYWLFIPTVFCENRNPDVIRKALHNELSYAVTDKYKRYTKHLVEALKNGNDINAADILFT
jgi:altronate hydrolase